MAAVWVVVAILAIGTVAAIVAARRASDDVEPTVREFAEFRDAISRQVADADEQLATTRRHVDGEARA
jgi:hypothetical protein